MDDEYTTLVEAARDALGDLLRASEPGTGLALHSAYNSLKQMLARAEDGKCEPATRGSATTSPPTVAGQWKRASAADRDRWVLEALADDRVLVTEVERRVTLALGDEHKPGQERYFGISAGPILKRLLEAREIDRAEVPGYRGGPHPRWLYFRRTRLSGPIVDLDSQFNDAPEAE